MKFSEKGAGGGQRPFGNSPEIHPFLRIEASLTQLRLRSWSSYSSLCGHSHGFWLWAMVAGYGYGFRLTYTNVLVSALVLGFFLSTLLSF